MYAKKLNRFNSVALMCLAVTAWAKDPQPAAPTPPIEAVPAPFVTFNFDKDKIMKVPSRFLAVSMPQSPDIRWEVQKDHRAPSKPNTVVQIGKASPGENFALLVLEGKSFHQGELSVLFKILGGEAEQSAGIIFRYTDAQNYDVIRASGRDDNIVFYHVKKGKAKALDTKSTIVTPYTWHELKVIFTDKTYTVMLDKETVMGGKHFPEEKSGLIGLWTKSDSQIAFDNLQVPL